jgi:tetratricopeptide (TPR) repeat protein
LPTIQAVEAEVARGNYAQAENMMHEVIVARPGSARAHYVYAEILAHDGHFDEAMQQAQAARQIAPNLGFTQPEEFRVFERELESEQRSALSSPARQSRHMGAPGLRSGGEDRDFPGWAWVLGAAALVALFWRGFSAPRPAASIPPVVPTAAPAGLSAAGYGAAPPATGYGPGAAVNATGSGMLGTALAATGGAAAGMLIEKLLDERGAPGVTAVPGASAIGTGAAPEANPAAADLEQRPIDFGEDSGSADNWADDGGIGGLDDNSGSDGNAGGDW